MSGKYPSSSYQICLVESGTIDNFHDLLYHSEIVLKNRILLYQFMSKIRIILNVVLPLLFGGIIYILYRSNSLVMFQWLKYFGNFEMLCAVREQFEPFKVACPSWIYFSLPNALWVYSFATGLLLVWKKPTYWLLLPLLAGCIVEVVQAFNYFPGTADIMDFVLGLIAIGLSLINNKNINEVY